MSNQITPNPSVPTQVVAEVKFPRWINNLGIIPTSYKDSMSYYECLAWLCKFLEETVIPSVNENGEAVQELQSLYIELNDYVTHYFETLDVQEEINNKLDDMAESGQLTEIIAQYLELQGLLCYNTKLDLKNAKLKQEDKLNQRVQENLIGIRVVKSFVREEYEINRFEEQNMHNFRAQMKYVKLSATLTPTIEFVAAIGVTMILWFGGNMVIGNTMEIGDLSAFLTYVTQILFSLTMLTMVIMFSSRAMASSALA